MLKKAYIRKMEAKLEEWGDEVSKLGAEAAKAKTELKSRYQEQLEVLRSRQAAARNRISELREAGGDNWGKLKSGVEDSIDDLKKAVDNAISKLKKIA
ncbi:MAG TPA: hypothetical protein VH866_11460 [Candidatus Deferrimicrobiaceae bacterium]|jgi:hypothetical protein